MRSEEVLLPGISLSLWKDPDATGSVYPSCHFFTAWVSDGPTGEKLQAKENQVYLFYLSESHVYMRHRKYTKYKPGYE